MKTVLTKIFALGGVALFMLSACKKDGALVTSNGGKAGTLAASTMTPVLDKNKLGDATPVVSFNFTKANYGFSAAVTNTLQIDAASDNWAHPTTVTLSNGVLTQGYSTKDFNNMVLKLNLPADVSSQIVVRVAHSISANVTPVYSNTLTLTVTPFNLTAWVYVPGAYEGWSNPGASEDSLISVTGNGVYVGIINFPTGLSEFLVTPKKNWDHKYATNDPKGAVSSTVAYDGPNNFFTPATAGWYRVTLNTNTNTIAFDAVNYYSAIGSATPGGDWSTDLDLKFINSVDQDWEASLSLTAGEFKVRQNHDWGQSWGIPKVGTAGYGIPNTLNNSTNDNIQVPTTGTHKVVFSIPVTLAGSSPSALATYSFN